MRNSLLLLVTFFLATAHAAAQMRPHADWQQLETEHFRVVFEAGLDSMAQHAGRRAEAAYARLSSELSRPPKGRIDIILGDNLDITNGVATPIPSNRILLWAKPPADDLALGYYNDWMDLVITHELTHIFHMDRAGKVGRALRTVFGRVPFGWPFFPVIGTPDWTLEGLATYRESAHTGVGRIYGTYHDMVLRTALLENDFDPLDRVNGETPQWPGGQRDYIYGSLFMQYLAQKVGAQAHRALIDKTASSILPPPWLMDGIARRATGKSFTQHYREWRAELQQRYNAQAQYIRAGGLTTGEPIAGGERYAWYPRVSPDGRRLAFVQEDGRRVSNTVVLDLTTRRAKRIRRNSLAPVAWANNTTLVTTQPELIDPYTIYSDLYFQRDGGQQRLTRGARYEAVDIDRSGRKLLVVGNAGGMTSLVERDAYTGAERVIVEGEPDVQWVSARWSPDGTRIAAQRWQAGGRHDVVILDTLGVLSLTRPHPWLYEERATDAAPTWSADGRYVLFTSDRSGVNNIYAFSPADSSGMLLQVTNVLTGVFFPEVSPDGAFIYYSVHHANGYSIERLPYDSQSWRGVSYRVATDTVPVNIPSRSGASRPVSGYSAWRSLLPTFWLPLVQHDSLQGTFVGAFTFGQDDVNRHSYFAALGINFENGRTIGALSYSYAGLGNPTLTAAVSREYDVLADIAVRREDNVALLATLRRPRWRTSTAFSAGVEGVVIRRDSAGPVLDTEDRLLGVIAGLAFGNARTPAYAISAEDGLRASIVARRRFDIDPVFNDDTYSELNLRGTGYKSLPSFGFAHHVLAGRVSAVHRTGLGIGPTDVGGQGDFLPVRGFSDGDRIGFTAWSASAEYRLPLAMIGRGVRMWPLFIDRLALSLFADAGNASCNDDQSTVYLICPGNPDRGDEVLLSAGVEVVSNVALLSFIPTWVRLGMAQPIQGPRSRPKIYFALGQAF
ncbi:MAG TPA: hypothetical protein VFO52_15350 [Longimicrobiales bacterium]|nr:hypothetical protein [Longimicrobiales bacterium]